MTVVLALEVIGGVALLVQVVRLFILSVNDPIGQKISLLLVVILGLLWAVITLVGAIRRRSWARATNLTLQVLLFAAAVGVLQGILGTPLVGALLLIASALGFIASLMVRPVV